MTRIFASEPCKEDTDAANPCPENTFCGQNTLGRRERPCRDDTRPHHPHRPDCDYDSADMPCPENTFGCVESTCKGTSTKVAGFGAIAGRSRSAMALSLLQSMLRERLAQGPVEAGL